MGLDMYLYRTITYPFAESESTEETIFKSKKISPQNIVFLREEIGYWRKANAIYGFFEEYGDYIVENGALIPVAIPLLKKLSHSVNEVIKDPSLAPSLLPTTLGFFFGSPSYDESYFENITLTQQILKKAFSFEDDSEFYYKASW